LDCYQNDFNQRKSARSAAKIFLFHAPDNIKDKESWPLIAQIFADKKSTAKGSVTKNLKIILIATWNNIRQAFPKFQGALSSTFKLPCLHLHSCVFFFMP